MIFPSAGATKISCSDGVTRSGSLKKKSMNMVISEKSNAHSMRGAESLENPPVFKLQKKRIPASTVAASVPKIKGYPSGAYLNSGIIDSHSCETARRNLVGHYPAEEKASGRLPPGNAYAFDLSTSFPFFSQGIIALNFAPTSSTGCFSPFRVSALNTGLCARHSSIHSFANAPD